VNFPPLGLTPFLDSCQHLLQQAQPIRGRSGWKGKAAHKVSADWLEAVRAARLWDF